MLSDPLIVAPADVNAVNEGTLTTSFGLRDLALGRTDRTGIHTSLGKLNLLIAHSESKENKGVLTDRSVIKISNPKQVADIGEVLASAQLTIAFPRAGFSVTDMVTLVELLVGLVFHDARGSGEFADYNPDTMGANAVLKRVLAGEP